MKEKNLLFAVGGTGGHLYPAIALADTLKSRDPSLSVLFAGGGLKNGSFFEKQPYSYHFVSSATLSLRNPINCPKNLLSIAKGFKESCSLLEKHSPSLVIGFGSYYSLPVLLAARWKKVPYVLHEQNTIPGRVIRVFSKGAAFTGIHFPEAKLHLKGDSRLVGMPLRKDFVKGKVTREEARKYFSLESNKNVVLVVGGSQGAAAINRMMFDGLKEMRTTVSFQVLHFTGNPSETEKLKNLYNTMEITSCVKDFEERMDLAWQASDCVISRAGAVSIAEQTEFEVPGILIPYPFAMDNHQEINADHFVNEVEGGVKFSENQGSGTDLINVANRMMQAEELNRLKENISRHRNQRKTQDFTTEILNLLVR